MRRKSFYPTKTIFGLLSALVFLPTIFAMAENGRDLAGLFSVTDVVGGTEEVSLSLSLEIFNYSGADITNATVQMKNSYLSEPFYETPTVVDIAYRDHVLVTEPVLVVPRHDYEMWIQGILPIVDLIVTDGNGLSQSMRIELVPRAMEREGGA